jgi:hypothetical protein
MLSASRLALCCREAPLPRQDFLRGLALLCDGMGNWQAHLKHSEEYGLTQKQKTIGVPVLSQIPRR